MSGQQTLGERLRSIREGQDLSLREIERRTDLTSGYLSQLERGEVSQPTPSSLARVAQAYGVELAAVMEWAGYMTNAAPALTPTQSLALKHLGPNPTEAEVEAIKAVLKVLRGGRHAFSSPHHLDRVLLPDDIALIRSYALALLREADALGEVPTPLDRLTAVAGLVYAGELELTLTERRSLIKRLGRDMLERILKDVHGLLSFRSREIWLKPDLVAVKKRFVHAHELGHHILPVHRELAYLDNQQSLRADVREACEREANQAGIELLAQGRRLTEEADDSALTMRTVEHLSARYAISLQATARRIAEESSKRRCAVIWYRGSATGKLMPAHIYESPSFAAKDRTWLDDQFRTLAQEAIDRGQTVEHVDEDDHGRSRRVNVSAIDTPYARIAVLDVHSRPRLLRVR